MLHYLIAGLVAASVLIAFAGFVELRKRARRVSDRLQAVRDDRAEDGDPAGFMDQPLPIHWQIVAFLGWLLPYLVHSESLRWELARAGWRRPQGRQLFAGSKVISTIAVGSGMALAGTHFTLRHEEFLFLVGAFALAGFHLPNLCLAFVQRRRSQEILLSLPDALDLMVICVEAGQGLNAALMSVGNEMRFRTRSMSDELRMVNHEMRAGLSRAQALRNLANRTGLEDTRSLVAVLVQSDRLGTSVAQALRAHAQSLRTRRRQRAEEAARKTAVKLVFPLVFCIFPALLVIILAPGMIQVVEALKQSAGG